MGKPITTSLRVMHWVLDKLMACIPDPDTTGFWTHMDEQRPGHDDQWGQLVAEFQEKGTCPHLVPVVKPG